MIKSKIYVRNEGTENQNTEPAQRWRIQVWLKFYYIRQLASATMADNFQIAKFCYICTIVKLD